MGSTGASFGNLPGNNAPTPVFGGTNPTGMMPGGFDTKSSFGFPSYSPQANGNNFVTPMANQGIFGPNNSATAGGSSGNGIQGLNSGFGSTPASGGTPSLTQLSNDYGKGIGQMLYNILNGGLFNSQVADAYMNAMQPAYNRGIASTEQAFGAEGARFGSSAALGIGDFASQFSLNEQQVMANMYMQAQQEQLNLLNNILPTINKEQDNSMGTGFWGTLAQQFDYAMATAPKPGQFGGSSGTSPSASNAGDGSSTSSPSPVQTQTSTIPMTGDAASVQSGTSSYYNDQYLQWLQSSSAGADLGGQSPSSSTGDVQGMLPGGY